MTISYQEISRRAYELWQSEGQPQGQEQTHWLQAEAELRQRKIKEQGGKPVVSKDPSMLKTPKRGGVG